MPGFRQSLRLGEGLWKKLFFLAAVDTFTPSPCKYDFRRTPERRMIDCCDACPKVFASSLM